MGHDGVASGHPTPTGFRRLTGCQQDPRDIDVTIKIGRPCHLTRQKMKPTISKSHNSLSSIISTVSLEYCNEGIVGAPLLASHADTLEGKVEGSQVPR